MSLCSSAGCVSRRRYCSTNPATQRLWEESRASFRDFDAMYDVIITGAGVAGSSLSILLGRAGCSVALFEKAAFPREKPCGEGIMPAGVAALERIGLLQAVGGQRFTGIRYIAAGT